MRLVERSRSRAPATRLLLGLAVVCAIVVTAGSGCGTSDGTPERTDAGSGASDAGADAARAVVDASADLDAGSGSDLDAGSGGDLDAGPDPMCPAVCPSGMCVHGDCVRRVFVTSAAVSGGSIGGVAGADAMCQRPADGAALGGRYRAWLAEPLDWPEQSFTRSRAPYVRVDGVEVAANWADLTDGTLVFPILYTESGADPADPSPWANVNRDGTRHFGRDCGDWTSDAIDAVGILGFTGTVAFGWTAREYYSPCTTPHPFYCFEQ